MFIEDLELAFYAHRDSEKATKMSEYMRNKFSFFGIQTAARRDIFKNILIKNQAETITNVREIALELYGKEQREFHYCAIELLIKKLKGNYKEEDILLIEKLITTNSWWDSVDTIAKNILGRYLKEFPECIPTIINRFLNSENLWLIRTAIIFQLGYKEKTDFDLLKSIIIKHQSSSEFFIQKAIGWALREYAKTYPNKVKNFVWTNDLKPLSKKEALKNL